MPAVKRNREREKSKSAYDPSLFTGLALYTTQYSMIVDCLWGSSWCTLRVPL